MVVKRSPFGSGVDVPVNPKGRKSGTGTVPTTGGTVSRGLVEAVAGLSSPKGGTAVGDKRSTASEERMQLQTAAQTLGSRLAGTGQYEKLMQDVQSVAAGKGKPSKGVLGWLKENVAGPVLDPFGFRDITKTIGIPQQYIESGLAYATESIINAPANILEVTGIAKGQQPIERTSAKEVWRRANDPDWGVFKDPKYQTGIKPLDTALQLTTDIGTDPFTFMGVGSAKYAGRAGREALALRFATPDMVAKYGDELAQAGVGFDEIVRYGEWALPKTIRETEGINSGLRFAGRTIKGTQGIGADVGMNLAKVRASVGDVVYKASPDLMSKIAPQSQKVGQALGVGRSAAVRGFDLSNKQVATALVGSTAQRHAKV